MIWLRSVLKAQLWALFFTPLVIMAEFSFAQALRPGVECTLKKRATLFEQARGSNTRRILAREVTFTVSDIGPTRSFVSLQDGSKGFIKTRRLRRVCKLSAPTSVNKSDAEAKPNPHEESRLVTLCKLRKSVSVFGDENLETRLRIARPSETLIILDQQPRFWKLSSYQEVSSLDQNPLEFYAKAKRLKTVCILKEHHVQLQADVNDMPPPNGSDASRINGVSAPTVEAEAMSTTNLKNPTDVEADAFVKNRIWGYP